jgi:Family of unknown function (DUF6030)
MVPRGCILGLVAALSASSLCAAEPIDFDRARDPAALCSALAPLGLDAGSAWQESAARQGGWSCERNGAVRECDREDAARAQGELAYFVFGSGRRKIDRAVLQLTLSAEAEAACRALLQEAAATLSEAIGIKLPVKIARMITNGRNIGEPASGGPSARAGRVLLHQERQGWVRVRLTTEDAWRTVLTVSFVNPNASRVWD